MDDVQHKHLIIRTEVNNPPKDPEIIKEWLRELVSEIGMKLLDIEHNPISGYVSKEGNEGLTAVCIIETSHIAMHVWDALEPALMQVDVYTCSTLDPQIVFNKLDDFDVVTAQYLLLDREHVLEQLEIK